MAINLSPSIAHRESEHDWLHPFTERDPFRSILRYVVQICQLSAVWCVVSKHKEILLENNQEILRKDRILFQSFQV